ncbi:hypothetical protein CYLTODRAFT_487280 [Cylindrobasidium torrendii FP15055 ss-10]|uniref:F-box domain-containing protein n=1 Tax=Cylindrobasidium torrendii FP15055 ss-10 TaxID=1314674 RepID=A0A0D7BLP1_9AGAR|nr:hypothetical protein CYLTODRAFT_487280 [Cylindrobasidium torrendii FP15055 ss-10]
MAKRPNVSEAPRKGPAKRLKKVDSAGSLSRKVKVQSSEKPDTAEDSDTALLVSPLAGLPVEILIEILGWLLPFELVKSVLHLSKPFRALLMPDNPHAQHIWAASRALAGGMPSPGPGLSEVEWTNLIFVKQCSTCKISNKSDMKPDFYLQKRLCKKCKKFKSIRSREWNTFSGTILVTQSKKSKWQYLRSDMIQVQKEHDDLPTSERAKYLETKRQWVKSHTDEKHSSMCTSWYEERFRDPVIDGLVACVLNRMTKGTK